MTSRSPENIQSAGFSEQCHIGHPTSPQGTVNDGHEQSNKKTTRVYKGPLSQYGPNYYIDPALQTRFPELLSYPFDEAPYRIPCLHEVHLNKQKFAEVRKEYPEFFARWDVVFRKKGGKGPLKSLEDLQIAYPNFDDYCTEEQYAFWCCYWNHDMGV